MSATMDSFKDAKPIQTTSVRVRQTNYDYVKKFVSFCIYMVLLVSMYQAGSFMWDRSDPGFDRIFASGMMVVGIALGHAFIYMFGLAWTAGRVVLAVVVCLIPAIIIECVSIYTSAAKYNKSTFSSIQKENEASPEYMASIAIANQRQELASNMTERMNNAPAGFLTQGRKTGQQAADQLDQAQRAVESAGNIQASSSQSAYGVLEDATGLTPVQINNSLAVFQSLAPMSVALYWGLIFGRRRINIIAEEAKTKPKKP